MKGLAGSLVTVINWLGSWVITYSFNFLVQWSSAGDLLPSFILLHFTISGHSTLKSWHEKFITKEGVSVQFISGTFFIFATVCGFTVIFITRLVPETKGRTLEEIQESMISFGELK